MNINELFEKIQDSFQEEIKGEYELQGSEIIWMNNVNAGIEPLDDFEEDEDMFGFETQTTEEVLIESYKEDLEKLEELLDNIEEDDNWDISDYEICENIISFKITPKE